MVFYQSAHELLPDLVRMHIVDVTTPSACDDISFEGRNLWY